VGKTIFLRQKSCGWRRIVLAGREKAPIFGGGRSREGSWGVLGGASQPEDVWERRGPRHAERGMGETFRKKGRIRGGREPSPVEQSVRKVDGGGRGLRDDYT